MISLLSAAEAAVEAASRAAVPDCPALLASAVELMTDLSERCVNMPAEERASMREPVTSRVLRLQARLAGMSRSLERSYAVVTSYSHRSGITSQEYSPRGLSHASREPSLILTRI